MPAISGRFRTFDKPSLTVMAEQLQGNLLVVQSGQAAAVSNAVLAG